MSVPVEAREYDGNNFDRAEEVSMSAVTLGSLLILAYRFMALPQHKKLPQPPEGSTFT